MALALRCALALALLCHGVIAGSPGPMADAAPRKLHGRFLHITDIHPDQYYKAHSSTDEDGACHRGKGPAGVYGAETSDCDSPFSLVNATFDWIADNLKDEIDFIVWTGDSARHDRDEKLPRSADQVLGTNTWIADKFADVFADKDDRMAIPVVPNFGNNDILPHNILLPGPNKWLQHYTHIWRRFIPEEQRHSFEFGGWFHVEVIPNKLAVFSLNTLYFFDRNAGVDGCAVPSEPGYKQMEWLRVQLQIMRERGMKAILTGHVPPARTESKKLWDETCWQRYSLWMQQFRDVVVVGLYGHMNIDHFLIHDNHEIDISALSGASGIATREAMDDELTIQSATDYLMELRGDWAKLTPPAHTGKPKSEKSRKGGRKGRGKKRKDPWGERYHLSLVSPSVYNISGLENNAVWADALQTTASPAVTEDAPAQKHLSLRHLSAEPDADTVMDLDMDTDTDKDTSDMTTTKKKNKKNKKHRKKPKKPSHDPDLHIPSPPPKTAPPGPAYSPQPLTLTGYTQYFANLTHINNLDLATPSAPPSAPNNPFLSLFAAPSSDADADADADADRHASWLGGLLRWRRGKHGGKKPVVVAPPRPRAFAFEVEYHTAEDRVLRLRDLTANKSGEGEESESESESESDEGEESDDDEDDGVQVREKKGKRKKGGKKRRKQNKAWLHFVRHAFVGTLEKDELKKFLAGSAGHSYLINTNFISHLPSHPSAILQQTQPQIDPNPMFPALRLPHGVLRRRLRRRRMATLLLLLVLPLALLLLPPYLIYKPPSPLLRYLSHRWTDVLFRVWLPRTKPLVALTIDDAPSQHTAAILAALAAAGARATFFVIGAQVPGREAVLRDMVRAGHELANHGMRDEPARVLGSAELAAQMRQVQGLIDAAYRDEGRVPPGGAGRRDLYYRPGSGFFSDRIRGVARALGYRLVLGSIYPHDAQIGYAWLNARHVLSMLSPGGIIICHDRRSWTEPMLRKVLPEMTRRGYKAVTVSELLDEVTG
ncbi:carbohydrate esterase family 4 protein [Trichocladium antarcticum]|uniref:Carbohydrate esterase family 4 protein n=1 Tax=Trichocladium antarcticum TaxID=1450529 RepID=A0AAN6ZB54_9PEZI|nr:carbohydrate esterase family 4 protein [Trichocladium antarcticum]